MKSYGYRVFFIISIFTSILVFQNCAKNVTPATDFTQGTDETPEYENEEQSSTNPRSFSARVVFSTTLGGSSASYVVAEDVTYGKLTGLGGTNVWGCSSVASSGECDDETNFDDLSANPDWSYSSSDSTWKMQRTLSDIPNGTYSVIFHDRRLNKKAAATITIQKSALILSAVKDGVAVSSISKAATLHGKAVGMGESNTYSCASATSSNECENDSSKWAKMPNADWSFSSVDKTWRFSRTLAEFPVGAYKVFFKDRNNNRLIEARITTTEP